MARAEASAESFRQSVDGDLLRSLIQAGIVDSMAALPSHLFFTTQIPVCRWLCGKNNTQFYE